MQQVKMMIIAGPRKYKETGPLHKAGVPFCVAEYRDSGPGKFFRIIPALAHTCRRCSPELIFSDMLNFSGIFVWVFSRAVKKKLVLRIRGEKFSQEKSTVARLLKAGLVTQYLYRILTFRLSSFVIRHADALIPDSTFGKEGMLKNTAIPPELISVVPIPVRFTDMKLTRQEEAGVRAAYGISRYTHVLLAVTGFDYAEKMRGAAEAVPQLADYLNRRGDTVMIIAGGGVLFPEFKKLFRAVSCSHILLPGFIDDIKPLYSLCSVFTHFSYQDGCPNIILEAMLAGKPVIANRFISFTELIDEGKDGYIIDLKNPQELPARLDTLLNDQQLCRRLGENGRRKVLKNHSEEEIGRQLAAAFSRLSGQWTGSRHA